MKNILITALSLLLAAPSLAAEEGDSWAFTNVTVIPMDEDRVIPAQTVIVRGGKIVEIGPANRTELPREAGHIDGRGRYLMPGLAEMHAHVPPQPDDTQQIEEVLFLYVAAGITYARSMLGAPHHFELRERMQAGDLVAPHLYLSGPSLNGNSVESPEHGRQLVARQAEAGYDFLKIHPGLDRARYDAIVETARAHDIAWAGHVSHQVGLHHALATGQATIDHLDAYMPALLRDGSPLADAEPAFFGYNLADEVDTDKIPGIARATREAGVWNVPTQSLIEHVLAPEPGPVELAGRAEMRYVASGTRERWIEVKRNFMARDDYTPERIERFIEVRSMLINALHEAGAGLLLGADSPQIFNVPGFAIHHELRMLVESGLTPYAALETGTVNVARFLGEEDTFGTVAEDMRADLLLLDENPLVDITAVKQRAGVMIQGRWYPGSELDAGLEQIADRHR